MWLEIMQPLAALRGSVELVKVPEAGSSAGTEIDFVCYLLAAACYAWGNTTDSSAPMVSLAGASDLPVGRRQVKQDRSMFQAAHWYWCRF